MSKIYSKFGDFGTTNLSDEKHIPKNNPIINALGNLDECNSCIGIALSFWPQGASLEANRMQLIEIQHALFDLGSHLSFKEKSPIVKNRFNKKGTALLEQWIDEMDAQLPKLQNFILPGGHPAGAHLHSARAVCRRLERSMIDLASKDQEWLPYINRLSDYLFMLARYVNFATGMPEIKWTRG